jgi:hypothetical protein
MTVASRQDAQTQIVHAAAVLARPFQQLNHTLPVNLPDFQFS